MEASEQTVVIRTIDGDGIVRVTFVLECVRDIEVTTAVELTTEPGVMGRIGPSFPRSASFRARVRDNDPRTPLHFFARQQLFFLRSLHGKLFYVDTRSSPPEKITWTLENLKSFDDNQATGSWDVDITVREIIGGEFGEFIDPNELGTETGLIPFLEESTSAEILGSGKKKLTLQFTQAAIRGAAEVGAFGRYVPSEPRVNFRPARQNDAAISDLYSPSQIAHLNNAAIGNVTNGRLPQQIFSPGKFRDSIILPYTNAATHVLVFGANLPKAAWGSLFDADFSVLGVNCRITVDATNRFQSIALAVGNPDVVGRTVYALSPNASYIVKRIAKDPDAVSPARRIDIAYPQDMDLFIAIAPDKFGLPFTPDNFHRFSIILIFAGGLAA